MGWKGSVRREPDVRVQIASSYIDRKVWISQPGTHVGLVVAAQVSRQLPSASLVRYPPPFGPISEATWNFGTSSSASHATSGLSRESDRYLVFRVPATQAFAAELP